MRILWLSNAEWTASGYGEQTHLFCRRFQDLGHDVAIAANHGLQGAQMDWDGITVYPASGNWGNNSISTFAEHHKADIVIALCDAWVLNPDKWDDDLKMAVWAPIDHYPIPPEVLKTLNHEQRHPDSDVPVRGRVDGEVQARPPVRPARRRHQAVSARSPRSRRRSERRWRFPRTSSSSGWWRRTGPARTSRARASHKPSMRSPSSLPSTTTPGCTYTPTRLQGRVESTSTCSPTPLP